MKSYLIALLVTVFASAVAGMLAPDGENGKWVRTVTSLILICVMIAPLSGVFETLTSLVDGTLSVPGAEPDTDDLHAEMDAALNEASIAYFTTLLTRSLCEEFAVTSDNIRCSVTWENEPEPHPRTVRVILSGSAIWKDPHSIEIFVTDLLGCECIVALE